MKKYIIHNDGIEALGLKNNLKHLSVITAELTAAQRHILEEKGIAYHKSEERKVSLLESYVYEKIRSEWKKVKSMGYTGEGVKVAVLDTGCNVAYAPADFVYNFVDDDENVTSGAGHGTRVSSIIKSSIGIAPGCELHHLKIVNDSDGMTEADFLQAIDYCIDNEIDVVNMSFGTHFSSMLGAMQDLWNAGIIPCAATGNSITDSAISTPAGMENVVAVNAIREEGTPVYKNYQLGVTDATHGVTIACSGYQTEGFNSAGGYTAGFGTSFACPFFVAGFAVYKEMLGIADNKKVLQHILNKAYKKEPVQYFGHGIFTF
jgi:subtilisin family serine protease